MIIKKRTLIGKRRKCRQKRILIIYLYKYIKNKKNRWVSEFNTQTKRDSFGHYKTLCQQLEEFPAKYFTFFRMEQHTFNKIFDSIKNKIEGPGTHYRKSISAKEKLSITLIHLAHAISLTKLALDFRLGISTVWTIVKEVCAAVVEILLPIYMAPRSTEDWKEIGNEFYRLWQMPNCLGALDGKHIQMFKPRKSGSKYYCYKRHFSIVLLAVCDAHYRFTMAHVGGYGSNSDAGIFAASEFGKAWLSNDGGLAVPEDEILPNSNKRYPYFLVADEAFPLKRNLLRPFRGKNLTYKKKIFNYRLSRARRMIENAFGILCHTWRILLVRMLVQPKYAINIVLCCVVLYNILRQAQRLPQRQFTPTGTTLSIPTNSVEIMNNREELAEWFVTEGKVEWQDQHIN